MAALPPSTDFTGSTVTEGQFKTALTSLRDFLNGLLGADGLPATARTALGVSQTINEVVLSANTTLNATTHFAKTIVFGANGVTATLPAPGTAGNGWWCWFVLGAGVSSSNIARNGTTELIFDSGASTAGVASLAMPGTGPDSNLWNCGAVLLMCNGTNWRVLVDDAAHGQKLFASSTTWVAPQGVTKVLVSGSGGGGSGGAAQIDGSGGTFPGGRGGNGGQRYRNLVTVTPGTTYTVTIGAGGAAVSSPGVNGNAGTATSLGALITIAAGAAGGGATSSAAGTAGANGASDTLYPLTAGTAAGAGGAGATTSGASSTAGGAGWLQLEW